MRTPVDDYQADRMRREAKRQRKAGMATHVGSLNSQAKALGYTDWRDLVHHNTTVTRTMRPE
jgi:hypothetical protein